MNNSELHEIAKQELVDKTHDEDLWRKAMTLMDSDEVKAKEKYIKLRILQMKRDGYQPKSSPKSQETEPTRGKLETQDSNPPKKSTNKPKEEPESNQDSSSFHIPEQKESNNSQFISNQWILWLFFGLMGLIIIFIVQLNIGNKTKEDISNDSYSKKPNDSSNYTSVKIDKFVKDSDLMHEFELKLKKEKEIKEREAIEAKEKADMEYLEAIREMNEESSL